MTFFLRCIVFIPWISLAVAQTPPLRSGPMVGYGQMTEVMLWVQTTGPASVHYRYWDAAEPAQKQTSAVHQSIAENAFIVKTVVTGLQPGKRYQYELLLDGKPVLRRYPLRFQTQPLWQWRTDPPEFTVAFGSCAYINEPEWDRPNNTYGGDYSIFSLIASKNPDLMLWVGDNTYLREADWETTAGIIHRNAHTRQTPELQPLLGAAHHYATWDDHDYGPNNADRSYRLRRESLEIFTRFWANQTYGTDETRGVFSRFTWGDVEFFLLDNRYHRAPNDGPDDAQRTMFGRGQMQWLKDALSNSTAPFKMIVNGNQMLNPNGEHYESLTQYRSDYTELLSYLKSNSINGVIFLSGDRHHTELVVLNDSSFYPLYDFTSSPLTSGLNTMIDRNGNRGKEFGNPLRVPGTLVNDKRNFGMLRFSGPRTDRRVLMHVYDAGGVLRWSKEIKANELRIR